MVLSLLHAEVWGNGDAALLQVLGGSAALGSVAGVLALRLVATTVCVGTGTVGGVFTPTVFAGAVLGWVAGHLLHVGHPVLLVVVGMSVFLAAVMRAPVMAAVMAVELTGRWELLPLLLPLALLANGVAGAIARVPLDAVATHAPTPTPTPTEAVAVS